MRTPLFYRGEVVRYGKDNILCVILVAYHYGREYPNQDYRERYIIESLEPERYKFDLKTVSDDGNKTYYNTNRCAGEYLRKIETKEPLYYNFNTEEIFEEVYKIQ